MFTKFKARWNEYQYKNIIYVSILLMIIILTTLISQPQVISIQQEIIKAKLQTMMNYIPIPDEWN